jgi:hypothetical protein
MPRPASTTRSSEPTGRVGKSNLHEAGPHWWHEILQSDRSAAMFLYSFRVLGYLLKNYSRRTLDAASYTLHLIGPDGPMLDPDDILFNLIIEAQLFAVFSSAD